jgi:hypothetical protein
MTLFVVATARPTAMPAQQNATELQSTPKVNVIMIKDRNIFEIKKTSVNTQVFFMTFCHLMNFD